MGTNPEKSVGNTGGEKSPKKEVDPNLIKKLGSTALGGGKK